MYQIYHKENKSPLSQNLYKTKSAAKAKLTRLANMKADPVNKNDYFVAEYIPAFIINKAQG